MSLRAILRRARAAFVTKTFKITATCSRVPIKPGGGCDLHRSTRIRPPRNACIHSAGKGACRALMPGGLDVLSTGKACLRSEDVSASLI